MRFGISSTLLIAFTVLMCKCTEPDSPKIPGPALHMSIDSISQNVAGVDAITQATLELATFRIRVDAPTYPGDTLKLLKLDFGDNSDTLDRFETWQPLDITYGETFKTTHWWAGSGLITSRLMAISTVSDTTDTSIAVYLAPQ